MHRHAHMADDDAGRGTRLPAWTHHFALGLGLALICALIVVSMATQARRLLGDALREPRPVAEVATPGSAPPPSAPPPSAQTSSVPTSTPPAPTLSAPALPTPALPAPTTSAAPLPAAPSAAPPAATALNAPSAGASTATTTPQTPQATTPSAASAGDLAAVVRELQGRRLTIPVAGVKADDIASGSFHQARDGHTHEALDLLAPRGTPIIAVEDGRIAKLFWSRAGGHTIYQFDPSNRFAYYYAHLDRYADGLAEAQTVRRGDIIGYVGSSGNARADAPHLHFAIFLLTPERQWWKGAAVDPYPVLRSAMDTPQ